MSQSTYSVVIIRLGEESNYFDYWMKGKKKDKNGEPLHSARLAFTELVDAKNKAEACRLMRAKYPGHQIDDDATARH